MSPTHSPQPSSNPRPSTDTERTLIPEDMAAPSETSSILTIHPTTPQPYRGFPSQQAYLQALHEWAESKKYVEQDNALLGFYGETTMQTLANKPRMEFGISKRIKQRRESKGKNEANAAASKKSRSNWTLGLRKAS